MKKITKNAPLVFIAILIVIALAFNSLKDPNLVHRLLSHSSKSTNLAPVQQPVQAPVQDVSAPRMVQPAPTPPPVYVPPKQWPQELTPTRFIRVPNPDNPSLGVINEFVTPNDDVEVDIDPEWVLGYQSLSSKLQVAIDDGSGFQTLADFADQHPAYGANNTDAELLKSKKIRYRLVPGNTLATAYWIISHKRFEKPKEYVPPEGKKSGSLSVAVAALRPLQPGGYCVDLEFKNTGDKTPIAVALHSTDNDKTSMWNHVATSLVDSTGREYALSEMTGINCLSTAPQNLTEIDAGESLSVTLKFPSMMMQPSGASSFTFQVEVVVNSNYDANSYSSYQPQNGVLPPNCKTHNVSFQIPLTQK